MANIFTLENVTDFSEKLNIDDLYEKKKQDDLNTVASYNKIVTKIHHQIKIASRQKINNQCCWYVVPEFVFGIPCYDIKACIIYIVNIYKTCIII